MSSGAARTLGLVTRSEDNARADVPWLQRMRGRFVVFEGPDGSGKSTQLKRLSELASAAGVPCVEVREPGGTPIGEAVRKILLDTRSEMNLRCEMLLYMASRAQLVEEVIRPALAKGALVIADRFVSSTYAYQGAGGGLPLEEIDAVAKVALAGVDPDLVILFDVDSVTAARRTRGVEAVKGKKSAKAAAGSLFDDRIEQRGMEFHERVRAGYLRQAEEKPKRHLVIDARKGPEEVWAQVEKGLGAREWGPAR